MAFHSLFNWVKKYSIIRVPLFEPFVLYSMHSPVCKKGSLLLKPIAPLIIEFRLSIWSIRIRLQLAQRIRDLALFNLAIDSKLRGCDLVGLKVNDVCHGSGVLKRAMIVQRKTHRPVQFELTAQTRQAITDLINLQKLKYGDYLFKSRIRRSSHISTRQYARIVKSWVSNIGLEPEHYGTHSMRRTKVSLIYRRTHNLRAIQLLLGHTKLESTV